MGKVLSPLAGKPAPRTMLINVSTLRQRYFTPDTKLGPVSFGTSGHRGSSLKGTFNEAHILATTQAICDVRKANGITGPLFLVKDTHALSVYAFETALSVLAANNVGVIIQEGNGYTPTPVASHAILSHNRGKTEKLADAILLTPSHNPPVDGGLKYNPTNGGPADTNITKAIEKRANELLNANNRDVKTIGFKKALESNSTHQADLAAKYIAELPTVIDMQAIRDAGLNIGVDVLGNAAVGLWGRISDRFGLNLTLKNDSVDTTFSFMTVDHDGKIRMDCSSQYAMVGLIGMKDKFDIAWGNDTDVDRHGIVTPDGLMNPNHYLSVAIHYLYSNREQWSDKFKIGKTLVSSSMIDRVGAGLGREVYEVPVGFKWFVPGLFENWLGFGGEESAGAVFQRRSGQIWVSEKDGITMGLLAAEILAKTDKTPSHIYADLTGQYGEPAYQRIDTPATPEQKDAYKVLTPDKIKAETLAGEQITSILTEAPGNKASIGGLKVTTENAWFAARPSGTEDIAKLYGESFKGPEHLKQVQKDAQAILAEALK